MTKTCTNCNTVAAAADAIYCATCGRRDMWQFTGTVEDLREFVGDTESAHEPVPEPQDHQLAPVPDVPAPPAPPMIAGFPADMLPIADVIAPPRRRLLTKARVLWATAVLALVAVLATMGVSWRNTHLDLVATEGSLTVTKSALERTQADLSRTSSTLATTRADLSLTEDALDRMRARSKKLGKDNAVLKECLDGVSRAFDYVLEFEYYAAVAALEAVRTECRAAYKLI